MERYRRVFKKDHHSVKRASREISQSERQELKTSERHQPPSNRGLLPTAPPLSGDDDYVLRWLAIAEAESKQDQIKKRRPSEPLPERNNDNFHRQINLMEIEPERKRKRRHGSSSDSSLIDSPPKRRSRELEDGDTSPPNRQLVPPKHKRKKQKITYSEPEQQPSSDPLPSPNTEVFHRRARHKTREDRYEPKTAAKTHQNEDQPKRKLPKNTTKGGRKKPAGGTGGELMQNFSSEKITNERLTIRPSNGPGLFMNGRASSPARRRGVPDLAFSEMDFLQHANRYQVGVAEICNNSKSREKEKRKASKFQNDISTFFKPSRAPLREGELNRIHDFSASASNLDSNVIRRKKKDKDMLSSHQPKLQNYSEYTYLGFDQPGPSSDKTSHRFSHIFKSPQTSTNLPSERATSYVSWSATQYSPRTTAMKARLANVEEARRTRSTTPESIRRIIQETGIFRDTGIGASVSSKRVVTTHPALKSSVQEEERIRNKSALSVVNFEIEHQTASQPSKTGGPEPIHERAREVYYAEPIKERLEQVEDLTKKPTTRNVNTEHFDEKYGWHQRPSPAGIHSHNPASVTRSEPLQRITLTPMSREQIAKQARIKRPLTVAPLTHESHPSTLQSRPEGLIGTQQALNGPQEATRNPSRDNQAQASGSTSFEEGTVTSLGIETLSTTQNCFAAITGPLHPSNPNNQGATEFTRDELSLTAIPTILPSGRPGTQQTSEFNGNAGISQKSHHLGLPVRGGSQASQRMIRPSHSPYLCSAIEVQPLYMRQMNQPKIYERLVNETDYDNTEDGYEELQVNADFYYEGMPYGDLNNEEYIYITVGETIDLMPHEEPQEIQHLHAEDTPQAGVWQPTPGDHKWYGTNHNFYGQSSMEDMSADYAEAYHERSREDECPDLENGRQNEVDMTWFWHPQWQY